MLLDAARLRERARLQNQLAHPNSAASPLALGPMGRQPA